MTIIISLLLAYAMSGIFFVITDLGTTRLDRPGWALSPTIPAAILVALMWVVRPYQEQYYLHGQWPRAIAFGTMNLVFEFLGSVLVFWGLITYLPELWGNEVFIVVCVMFVFCIGVFILPSIMAILLLPVTGLLSLMLNPIFPIRKKVLEADEKA